MSLDDDRLIKKDQLAAFLCLKRRGVEALMERGIIPYYRLSKRTIRFHWPSVKKVLDEYKVKEGRQ